MMIILDMVEGTLERREAEREPRVTAPREVPEASCRAPAAEPAALTPERVRPHPLAGEEVAAFLRRMKGE